MEMSHKNGDRDEGRTPSSERIEKNHCHDGSKETNEGEHDFGVLVELLLDPAHAAERHVLHKHHSPVGRRGFV